MLASIAIGAAALAANALSLPPQEATGVVVPLVDVNTLNREFLAHLEKLELARPVVVARVREGFRRYADQTPESFIPDALSELNPALRAALEAFDQGRMDEAVALFVPLTREEDPYVAVNALYFAARSLVALSRYEEAEALLAPAIASPEQIARHTPLAAALFYMEGYCQARDLRFDDATHTLDALRQTGRLPEPVRLGVKQTLLEIERRQVGTLDEVATVMTYVADRLGAVDREERVNDRQKEIIALLDKLIEQEQSQEQQQGGGSGRSQGQKSGTPQAEQNSTPREQSEAPDGAGQIGDLHAAPTIQPGESWGNLPPADRERILQNIRERYPSRYRQLVEQYYRSLAEDK